MTSTLATGDALRALSGGTSPRSSGAELRRAAVAVTLLDLDTTPRVLVLKRAPRGLNAGQWALPGGKLEPGEDAETAALSCSPGSRADKVRR